MPQLPPKDSPPTPDRVAALRTGLNAVISGHVHAVHPWTFYEVIEDYLGPWGNSGYPIGYGKFYCRLFNEDKALQNDPEASVWVRRTTVLLQEALRDYIVQRYQAGTLPSLQESELRQAAFDSHAQVYTNAGLARVALSAPRLLPLIVVITRREFLPTSPSFGSSVTQVFQTIGLLAPETAGLILLHVIPPAHRSPYLRRLDPYESLFREQRLASELIHAKEIIKSGKLDNPEWLNTATRALAAAELPDESFRLLAVEVLQAANARLDLLESYYNELLDANPDLAPELRELIVTLCRDSRDHDCQPPRISTPRIRGGWHVPNRGGAHAPTLQSSGHDH